MLQYLPPNKKLQFNLYLNDFKLNGTLTGQNLTDTDYNLINKYINEKNINDFDNTIFHYLCKSDIVNNKIFQKILDECKEIKVNQCDAHGNYPILKYYSNYYFNKYTKFSLLDYSPDFDLNVQNNQGNTLLMLMCQNKDFENIKYIFSYKMYNKIIDVNLQNEHLNTALHISIDKENEGKTDIIELLLNGDYKYEFNLQNNCEQDVLHLAFQKGNVKIANKILQKNKNINNFDNSGRHILHYTSFIYDDIVKNCIKNQYINYCNSKDMYGNTPLHYHVECNNNISNIKFLIDIKADINSQNNVGDTALMRICGGQNFTNHNENLILDLLNIECPNIKTLKIELLNKKEEDIFHLILKNGTIKIVKLFLIEYIEYEFITSRINDIFIYLDQNSNQNTEKIREFLITTYTK